MPNEWSPVPDKNIYSFGYLDRTTGGYALCTDYYDYPLSQNEIDELLKEKEEEIKEEEKDSFYDDSSYSSAWVNRYKKKAKAYKYAYKKYKKGFAAIMREVENPYDPGNRAVVYAFTTSFEEVNNGWSYVADEDIPEDAYIFYTQTGSEDAKNYYYAIVNDMTYKKLLK